jgi:hypothetical protein
MLSNPLFGVDWKKIQDVVRNEHARKGYGGRFGPGLHRVSDGSLLFLLHLLSKMRPSDEGGSRFGIVLNGSPLFKGDAGNGEGDIYEYFEREVKPHVPDAWINDEVRDEKDGKIGKLGYEISFNRYFYVYKPLDLWKRSKRISRLWSPE